MKSGSTGGVILLLALPLLTPELAAVREGPSQRRVEFTYSVAARDIPRNATCVAVWVPVPPSNGAQELLGVEVLGPHRADTLTDPLRRARRLYDHIVDTMLYDKSKPGWGRGDALRACDVRSGNCTDFHSLFIAEARAVGIPARFIMGVPLPQGQSEGAVAGYHCWAEFYVAGLGWVPVDASEAQKLPEKRDALFAGLDANRIQFTVGRDITLPCSVAGPLNYIIYPHIEVDGAVHTNIETHLSFRDLP